MSHYLLDENLSRRLVTKLSTVFNVSHVANEGLVNSFDHDIWLFAKERRVIIITKDTDFTAMSQLYGCPPKVIKLNCGNRTTDYIEDLLFSNAALFKNFAESDKCYLEII